MILQDLIKTHGTIERVKKGRWEHEELNPGSRTEIINIITAWFDTLGWKTKLHPRTKKFTSRIPKHHTKINWEITSGYGSVHSRATLASKTPNGGWTTVVRPWSSNGDLGSLVTRAATIAKPTMVSKDTLPEAFAVGTVDNILIDPITHRATVLNKWYTVAVKGVVGLKKDGTVSVEQVFDPNENPWFHCVINDHTGRVAHVITDGDVLHPLNPRKYKGERKYRVTTNVEGFLKKSTIRDKELLTLAISTFFSDT